MKKLLILLLITTFCQAQDGMNLITDYTGHEMMADAFTGFIKTIK